MEVVEGPVEAKIEKILEFIKTALICTKAIIVYHIVYLAAVIATAVKYANDNVAYGFLLAILALLVCAVLNDEVFAKMHWLGIDEHEYRVGDWWIVLFVPLAILAVSSCLLTSRARYAVINYKSSVRAVNEGSAWFIPYFHELEWFPKDQTIDTKLIAQTKEGKNVQANVKAELRLIGSKKNLLSVYHQQGSQKILRKQLTKILQEKFEVAISRYELSNIPREIVIEDLVGEKLQDFSRYGVKWAGIMRIDDIHRYFAGK